MYSNVFMDTTMYIILYDLSEKFFVKEDEINKISRKFQQIQSELDNLKNRERKVKIKRKIESLGTADEAISFCERELAIIEYIRNNPGTTKQKLADYCKENGHGARKTTWNNLNYLIENNIIISKSDEKNSQTHNLYLDETNLINTTLLELREFEKSFKIFLENMRVLKNKDNKKVNYESILSNIMKIYLQALNSYMILGFLHWPIMLQDMDMARKLLNTVIMRMIDILILIPKILKISIRIPEYSNLSQGDYSSPIVRAWISDIFRLSYPELYIMINNSKDNFLENEMESLIQSVWKITFTLLPYTIFTEESLFSDGSNEQEKLLHTKIRTYMKNNWRYAEKVYEYKGIYDQKLYENKWM